MAKSAKVKWECPECKAPPNEHGKGGEGECEMDRRSYGSYTSSDCQGFICECDVNEDGHGESQDKPCLEARCYHCDWSGRFPPLPKKLKPFEKLALAAGWTPPKGWVG